MNINRIKREPMVMGASGAINRSRKRERATSIISLDGLKNELTSSPPGMLIKEEPMIKQELFDLDALVPLDEMKKESNWRPSGIRIKQEPVGVDVNASNDDEIQVLTARAVVFDLTDQDQRPAKRIKKENRHSMGNNSSMDVEPTVMKKDPIMTEKAKETIAGVQGEHEEEHVPNVRNTEDDTMKMDM